MDIAKLEKMKVIDLRNELQSRGLDTKGVKAVLIERLRAHVEGASGEGAPGTPGTPGRRSRRTRSMTRSPSCSPVRKTEPTLEPLEEESNTAVVNIDEEMEESQERYVGSEQEDIADEPDEQEQYHEIEGDEIEENEEEQEVTEGEDNEEEMNEVATNEPELDQQDSNEEQMEDNIENIEDEENSNSVDETSNKENDDVSSKANEDSIEPEEKINTEKTAEHVDHDNNDVDKDENVASEELNTKDNVERNKENDDLNRSRKRSRDHSRSHSRTETRSRSPKRRSDGSTNISPTKGEDAANLEDEPVIEDKQFGLSWFDSDLHLRIDPVTFTSAKPISEEIYALVWSGARTNFGVREGKVCYEVRLSEEVNMDRTHQFRHEPHVRGFRVGFSMPDSTLILGEAENSFAYCESGRIVDNSDFIDYGKPYQLDDVIGCYLDLESTPCTIKYTLNGEDLGVAFEFDISILGESDALFPHVVTKGYEFQVNFADNENLLANVERPKRMRRKPRKDKDSENWKVIDEAKIDDDEKQEESTKDEDKQTNNETVAENAAADKNDGADDNTNENEKESVEMSNDNKNKAESTTSAENGNDGEKTENDIEDEQTKSEKDNDLKESTEKDSDGKVEYKDNKNIDEKDEGISPSKKQKTEDEEKKYQSDSTEDEFEEVLPEPRETVFLLPDYELIALIPEEKYVPGPQKPDSRKECEVILLVGLPGAGKTHWALNHIKENPNKRYHIIGVDALISKMTVDGVGRKSLHKGRWEKVYDLCMKSLSLLEDIATKRRRNFILDQTNAYASVQRRKMKGFGDFKRIAVVCIPNEEELNRRNTEKTENGIANTIRESTLNSLRANFSLPSLEFDWFDDIIYSDLSGDEAKEEVKKYNEKGKKELDANPSNRDKRNRRDHHYKREDDRRRYNDRRHDFRNDNRRNDRYNDRRRDFRNDNRRIDRRGVNSGGWNSGGNNQPYWMQNNRNRYDDRYNHRSSGNGSQQNWGQNRNRYDDRYNHRSGGNGGGGGGRYDSYGGGGGGSRDYRDRNNRQQRDFRPGHRDNRTEDSRGGYDRSGASSSKHSKDGYDQYNSNKGPNQGGKWSTYGQQATQQPQQHANWQQANQYQQQQAAQQQQYWNYNNMQGGYDNQQQWQNANPNQQQDWMSWWQQQGGNPQQSGVNEANHYWSQYSYPAPATQASNTEATKKK